MNTNLLIRISIRSLKKHKGRSLLTMLGIIIGIAAIIATLAIGKGAEKKLTDKILSMGNNFISIYPGNWLSEGKTTAKKRKKTPHLRFKDIDALKKQCPEIKYISPELYLKDVIRHESNNIVTEIKCGNEHFLHTLGRKCHKGIPFNSYHVTRGARVIILGYKAATELFKKMDPIGQTVYIKQHPFTVIGVLEKMDNYWGIRDPNLNAFIPITTAKRQLTSNNTIINGISLSSPSEKMLPVLTKKIKKIMRYRRDVEPGETDNFLIFDQTAMRSAAKESSNILNILLLIVASISLLVGGIGVMNIMLVSVSERTKEIGIRMALGATSNTILKQFIIESIMMCFIGGTIGILIGIFIPHVTAYFTKWQVVVTSTSIIIAFATTSAIGMFFGFYPAHKAAKMNPVDALQDN
jgi:putative ABC transport system permease protein